MGMCTYLLVGHSVIVILYYRIFYSHEIVHNYGGVIKVTIALSSRAVVLCYVMLWMLCCVVSYTSAGAGLAAASSLDRPQTGPTRKCSRQAQTFPAFLGQYASARVCVLAASSGLSI